MLIGLLFALGLAGYAKDGVKKIPAHSKVYVAPMDGYENDLKAALEKKKVPLKRARQSRF